MARELVGSEGSPDVVRGYKLGFRLLPIWIQNHGLCDLGRVPNPLWISMSSSLKWGSYLLLGLLW